MIGREVARSSGCGAGAMLGGSSRGRRGREGGGCGSAVGPAARVFAAEPLLARGCYAASFTARPRCPQTSTNRGSRRQLFFVVPIPPQPPRHPASPNVWPLRESLQVPYVAADPPCEGSCAPCADARCMQVTSSDARRRRHAALQFRLEARLTSLRCAGTMLRQPPSV